MNGEMLQKTSTSEITALGLDLHSRAPRHLIFHSDYYPSSLLAKDDEDLDAINPCDNRLDAGS
jgi:hypothetical protein